MFQATLLPTLLATLLWSAPTSLQEEQQHPSLPPLLRLEQVEIRHHSVQGAEPKDVLRLAERMVGRQFYVEERGGYQAQPVSNMSLLGTTLVLYDTPDYLDRVEVTLRAIEASSKETSAAGPLTTQEYTPRYVSLDSCIRALESFGRKIHPDGNPRNSRQNISFVAERGTLILRDTAPAIEEMMSVLARIDVPAPQVVLSAYLLSTDGADHGISAPQELLQNMKALLPSYEFHAAGFSLLQTTVSPGGVVELSIEGGPKTKYLLRFKVLAYDVRTGSVTVERCELEQATYAVTARVNGVATQESFTGYQSVFSTNAVLRGGEYTVLGASGKDPVFLVLRAAPISG